MDYLTCSLTNLPTLDAVYDPASGQISDRLIFHEKNTKQNLSKHSLPPIKVNLDLKNEETLGSKELIEREIEFLKAKLTHLDECNSILSQEISRELIKKHVLSNHQSEIKHEVETKMHIEQTPFSSSSFPQNNDFLNEIKKLYKDKIETNKKVKLENKPLLEISIDKINFREVIFGFEATFIEISDSKNYIFLIDENSNISFVETTNLFSVDCIQIPSFPIVFTFHKETKDKLQITLIGQNEIIRIEHFYQPKSMRWHKILTDFDFRAVKKGKLHSSGAYFVVSTNDKIVFLSSDDLRVQKEYLPGGQIHDFELHPDGKLIGLLREGRNYAIDFFDLIEGKVMASFENKGSIIRKIIFSNDRFQFLAETDELVLVADIRTRKVLKSFKNGKERIFGFNFEGNYIFNFDTNKSVLEVLNAYNFEHSQMKQLNGHIKDVCFAQIKLEEVFILTKRSIHVGN